MQTFYYIASWVAALATICQLIIILYKIFFSSKPLVVINIIKYIPLLVILLCISLFLYRLFDFVTNSSNYRFHLNDLIEFFIIFIPFIVIFIVQWMWNGFVIWNKDYRKWKQILLYLFAFIMLAWFWFITYMFYKFGVNYHCGTYCWPHCNSYWSCTGDCEYYCATNM